MLLLLLLLLLLCLSYVRLTCASLSPRGSGLKEHPSNTPILRIYLFAANKHRSSRQTWPVVGSRDASRVKEEPCGGGLSDGGRYAELGSGRHVQHMEMSDTDNVKLITPKQTRVGRIIHPHDNQSSIHSLSFIQPCP